MLDLDFKGLRAEAEEATRLPEFTEIRRRAARVRRRGRAVTTAAMLGVASVVAAIGLAAAPPRGGGAERPPGDTVTHAYPVAATADGHGLAMFAECPPDGTPGCYLRVVPFPGGKSRSAQWLTGGFDPVASRYVVSPLGPAGAYQFSVTVDSGLRTFHTFDGGRTWRVPKLESQAIDAAPDGAPLVPCPSLPAFRQLCVLRAGTSTLAPLANQPLPSALSDASLPSASSGASPPSYATITGTAPVVAVTFSGIEAVIVTDDGGRTWKSHTFADSTGFMDAAGVAVVGRTVYCMIGVLTGRPSNSGGPVHPTVFATDDGGRNWRQRGVLPQWADEFFVRADGALVAFNQAVTQISRDGGATFQKLGNARPPGRVSLRFDGGIAVAGSPGKLTITTDGENWRTVTFTD